MKNFWAVFFLFALSLSGCGYTSKTILPENIKSIHVAPVQNTIDLSAESEEGSAYRTYRPGIEVNLTNEIINRFVFEGTLKVALPDKADAIVEAKIKDYRRDALRYTESDDIQEYRISLVADVAVYTVADRKLLWQESLTGDSSFYLSGPRAVSEDEAAAKAVQDLARRIVERTITLW